MNSTKVTNILLLALVLLIAVHVAIETFRPVGRYVWTGESSNLSVLDTSNGTLYLTESGKGTAFNIVLSAKDIHDASAMRISR